MESTEGAATLEEELRELLDVVELVDDEEEVELEEEEVDEEEVS